MPSYEEQTKSPEQKHQTPTALMLGVEALLAGVIKSLDVRYDPEAEIDPAESYIVAISHKTGLDVPIVIKALGDVLDLAVTDQSTHHGPMRLSDPTTISVKIIGEENFIPISYVQDGREKRPSFNPADAYAMTSAMERGKSLIVAAHNPSDKVAVQDLNTVRPGYTAALLAHLTGAKILPVLVDIDEQGQGIMRRKNARVFVGAPYAIEGEQDMGDMQTIMNKRGEGMPLSEDERRKFFRLSGALKDTGRHILDSIAHLDAGK